MQNQAETPTVEAAVIPIDQQINQELVKHNVTETLIADLKEKYLPLKLRDLNDKETYLVIKEGRKDCKSLRVMAEKICKKGREDAIAIQKAWIAKEKDVAGRIGEVEDHLEKQEKAYEAEQERLKLERKRKLEEQMIKRQTLLTQMGALYSDGSFILGDVSYESELIKECEDDIWDEQILPKFQAEYEKIEAERLEQKRKEDEERERVRQQQEELERKQKELEQREAQIKQKEEEEKKRKEQEEKDRHDRMVKSRSTELEAMGMKFHFPDSSYIFEDVNVHTTEITVMSDDEWTKLIEEIKPVIEQRKADAEQKRLAEIEEQKAAERRKAAGRARFEMLSEIGVTTEDETHLCTISDDEWRIMYDAYKKIWDKAQHDKWIADMEEKKKQEEIKRQQEIDQAKDKEKWEDILEQLSKIEVHEMRSGQYRKKAAILREKLEEIKSL
jgi:hypothetical protein